MQLRITSGRPTGLMRFSPAQVEKHLSKLTNAVRQHLGISRDTSKQQDEGDLQPAVKEPEKVNYKEKRTTDTQACT